MLSGLWCASALTNVQYSIGLSETTQVSYSPTNGEVSTHRQVIKEILNGVSPGPLTAAEVAPVHAGMLLHLHSNISSYR